MIGYLIMGVIFGMFIGIYIGCKIHEYSIDRAINKQLEDEYRRSK